MTVLTDMLRHAEARRTIERSSSRAEIEAARAVLGLPTTQSDQPPVDN